MGNVRYPEFSWWQGVVEDRDDPALMGRYRVRILGHHTQNKEKLPTEHLPWSIPLQPISSAAISGIGTSPTGLVEGSAVMGFFADGDEGQIPVIMGSFGVTSHLPREDDNGEVIPFDRSLVGFYDPKGVHPHYRYPKRKVTNKQKPEPADGVTHSSGRPRETPEYSDDGEDVGENILQEADSSRLSRGVPGEQPHVEEHYSLKGKRESRVTDIPIAMPNLVSGGTKPKGFTHPPGPEFGESVEIKDPEFAVRFWNEPHPQQTPPDMYADPEKSKSKYPFNHVTETESGHVFEVDDTLGAERIHEYHRTGTFYEVQPTGDKVTKVVGDDFEIDLKNKLIYIKGDYTMTVDGDYFLNVKGSKVEHISGHCFQTVRGTRVTKVQGNDELDVESTSHTMIRGNRNVQVGSQDEKQATVSNDSLRVTGDRNVRVRGKMKNITVSDRKDITFGNHSINVYPKYENDLREILKKGAEAVGEVIKGGPSDASALLGAFQKRSKLELFAQQDVSIATNLIYPDPFLPLNPAPSVSIATARYNLIATADLYEKIGPVAMFTGAASIILKPGFATRQAVIAINNIQGVDTGIFSLLPGIQNFVTAGGMTNNVMLGGIINNVFAGGILSTVVAGGIFNTVIAGGVLNTVVAGGIVSDVAAGGVATLVGAGGITENVVAGGIARLVTAGGITDTVAAGGIFLNVIGGAITMTTFAGVIAITSGAAVNIQAAAAATLTAGGAVTATATGAAVFAGGVSTSVGGAGPTTISGNPIAIG